MRRASSQWIPVLLSIVALAGCGRPGGTHAGDEKKEPWYLKGQEHRRQLNYDAALDAFHKALEVNPRSSAAHQELGILYEQHKSDPASAIFHYNRFLALNPESPAADKIRDRISLCQVDLVEEIKKSGAVETRKREVQQLRDQLTGVTGEKEKLLHENKVLRQRLKEYNPALANTTPPQPPQPVSTQQSQPQPAPSTSASPRKHKVKSGETVTGIARQYRLDAGEILAANRGLNPRRMRVGYILNIPSRRP